MLCGQLSTTNTTISINHAIDNKCIFNENVCFRTVDLRHRKHIFLKHVYIIHASSGIFGFFVGIFGIVPAFGRIVFLYCDLFSICGRTNSMDPMTGYMAIGKSRIEFDFFFKFY